MNPKIATLFFFYSSRLFSGVLWVSQLHQAVFGAHKSMINTLFKLTKIFKSCSKFVIRPWSYEGQKTQMALFTILACFVLLIYYYFQLNFMLFSHTGLLASVPWLTEGVKVSWETRRPSCSHKNRNASTEKQSEQFFTVTGRVSTLSVYLILPAPHCWCLYKIPTHVVKLGLWVSPAEKIIFSLLSSTIYPKCEPRIP